MNELIALLSEICPTVDFATETDLIDSGKIDSFEIVSIVTALMEHYDIELDVEDLLPENFNSARAILDLVEERRG